MEFRLLGPLEALDNERQLPLGGAKQRALLAVLLLRANELVSVDRLIDDLWAEQPPETAAHVIQVYVSQLRKVLGADAIVTRKPGYILAAGPTQVDLRRFEQLAEEGVRRLKAGDAETSARTLREALALWRGPALSDFTFEPFAQGPIARLEELRLAVLEERIEADLRLGGQPELIGELEQLVGRNPLRERPRGQLMLALYRAGRQAEALDCYQEGRRALVDELGIDPSPALQALERAILRQDPELDLEAREAPGSGKESAGREPRVEPARAILVVPREDAELDALAPFAALLAGARIRHGLVVLRLAAPGDDLQSIASALQARRAQLAEAGTDIRAAAFTSSDEAEDVVRMASQQDIDLLLLDRPESATDPFGDDLRRVLEQAPCDIALRVGAAALPGPDTEPAPVAVPFGGNEHEWAALEMGAWAASALGAPLRLLGTREDPDRERRDASRLLASASLAVQQLAGVVTEPVLVDSGEEAMIEAVRESSLVVLGCSSRWHQEGIGPARQAVARAAGSPVLVVRRGVRPGGMSPPASLTRFTWSLTGGV